MICCIITGPGVIIVSCIVQIRDALIQGIQVRPFIIVQVQNIPGLCILDQQIDDDENAMMLLIDFLLDGGDLFREAEVIEENSGFYRS